MFAILAPFSTLKCLKSTLSKSLSFSSPRHPSNSSSSSSLFQSFYSHSSCKFIPSVSIKLDWLLKTNPRISDISSNVFGRGYVSWTFDWIRIGISWKQTKAEKREQGRNQRLTCSTISEKIASWCKHSNTNQVRWIHKFLSSKTLTAFHFDQSKEKLLYSC